MIEFSVGLFVGLFMGLMVSVYFISKERENEKNN